MSISKANPVLEIFKNEDLINKCINTWYEKNIACGERSFQYEIGKIIEENLVYFKDVKVFIEPTLVNKLTPEIESIIPKEEHICKPDLLVCINNEIVAGIELKFKPSDYMNKDIKSIKHDYMKLNYYRSLPEFSFEIWGASYAQRPENNYQRHQHLDGKFELKDDRHISNRSKIYESIFCFLAIGVDKDDSTGGFDGHFINAGDNNFNELTKKIHTFAFGLKQFISTIDKEDKLYYNYYHENKKFPIID